MRPNNRPDRRGVTGVLSGEAAAYPVLRYREEQKPHLSDEQFSSSTAYHRGTVQMPVAGGAVLQMDQAAPADQGVLWDIRECRKDSDMDSHLYLCVGGDCQKATQSAV